MARHRTCLFHNEPGRVDGPGLHRRRIDAIVPDQRIRHHENLAPVRRIRERFRVARHVRVEDELAEDLPPRPKKRPPDGRSVLEDEGATHPLDPHPIFDSPYERFSRTEERSRGPLGSAREIQVVQPLHHFVPVTPLPIDALARGAAPELVVARPDPLRDEAFHVVNRNGAQDFIAERAPRERVHEAQPEDGGHLPNLLLEVVTPDLDRAGYARSELLVARQQDPPFPARAVDELAVRPGWGICRVVPHEAEPPRKAAEHVVAQELHRITEYSNRTPSPRRLVRSSRNRVESATDVTPSPPTSVGHDPERVRVGPSAWDRRRRRSRFLRGSHRLWPGVDARGDYLPRCSDEPHDRPEARCSRPRSSRR